MSNKELTPIQELIEFFSKSRDSDTFSVDSIKEILSDTLPTERTFAEGLYDGGYKSCKCTYFQPQTPDFSQFYKKYE